MIRFEPPDSSRGRMNGTGNMNSTRPRFGGPGRFNAGANDARNTTQAPILLGIGGGLLFLSISLLSARLWSRRRPGSRLSSDDWMVLAATLLAIGQYALLSAAVVYGLGRFARFVSLGRRRVSLELLFISQIFWYWSITLVKLSVAFLLLKVKHTRSWRIFLHAIITLILLAAIVQTCFQFLQCRPFKVYWDPRVFRQGPVICFNRKVINGNIVAFSSVQVALDLIFSFIPITFIRKLNRPRREKALMCVLMALGIFASIAAIIRTMTLQEFYTTGDTFRINVSIALWAVVEQQFALIAATIPTLKSFMEQVLVKIGLYFYDEDTETRARDKLVHFGFLSEDDVLEKDEGVAERSRKMSDAMATVGSPRSEKKPKADWSITEMLESISDKDVEVMLANANESARTAKSMV